MKRMTEYRHSFLLMSNEFHDNHMSEAHTLLEGGKWRSAFSTCFDRLKNLSQEVFTKMYSVAVMFLKIGTMKGVYGEQRCSSIHSHCQ